MGSNYCSRSRFCSCSRSRSSATATAEMLIDGLLQYCVILIGPTRQSSKYHLYICMYVLLRYFYFIFLFYFLLFFARSLSLPHTHSSFSRLVNTQLLCCPVSFVLGSSLSLLLLLFRLLLLLLASFLCIPQSSPGSGHVRLSGM